MRDVWAQRAGGEEANPLRAEIGPAITGGRTHLLQRRRTDGLI